MKKNKTLYISDLDGTLLKSNQTISKFTAATINQLVENGILFSYATARSLVSSRKVLDGLCSDVLSIVYNGTFIMNNNTGEIIISNSFSQIERDYIERTLRSCEISPIVYAFVDGEEKYTYHEGYTNAYMDSFIQSRNDCRKRAVNDIAELYRGESFYYSCIGDKDYLKQAKAILESDDRFNCIYSKDVYDGSMWLEILPLNATKAKSIEKLKQLYNCDKVIAFGDGVNDINMFEIADECYATENACDELKQIATATIGNNNDDAVAKWLVENVK